MSIINIRPKWENTKKNTSSDIFSKKIRAYSEIVKSKSQRGGVYASCALTGAVLSKDVGLEVMLAPIVTLFIAIATYIMNDIVDIDVDRVNAPDRPLASGRLSKNDALFIVVLLSSASLAISFTIGITTMLIVGANLVLGILYSAPKIALKNRFILKTAAVAIGGFLTFMIGASINENFDKGVYAVAFSFSILVFATSPISDLADYKGDKKNGRRTIPIVLGPANTILISAMLPISITLFFWLYHQQMGFNVITPLVQTIITLFSTRTLYLIYKNRDNYKYISKRHKQLLLIYFGLNSAFILGVI